VKKELKHLKKDIHISEYETLDMDPKLKEKD